MSDFLKNSILLISILTSSFAVYKVFADRDKDIAVMSLQIKQNTDDIGKISTLVKEMNIELKKDNQHQDEAIYRSQQEMKHQLNRVEAHVNQISVIVGAIRTKLRIT